MKNDSITIFDIALIFAAKDSNIALVKQLLAKGANPKAANSHGNTGLIMACQESCHETSALLILEGSDVNASNAIGNTGLLYAAYNGRLEITKQLISAGAHINASNHQGMTPLIYAAYNGHLQIVQFLIENSGAEINQCDIDERSALMWAIIRGKKEVALYLLSRNVNVLIPDNIGCTISDWLKVMQRVELEQNLKPYLS